jgi:CysZ protein
LLDFTLERKRCSIKSRIKYSKDNRWNITGTGIGFIHMLLVPLIGWFTAPAFAAVAATLNTLEKRSIKNENKQ